MSLGPELAINPNFIDTLDPWTFDPAKGTAVWNSNGNVSFSNDAAGTYPSIRQQIATTAGLTYTMACTIVDMGTTSSLLLNSVGTTPSESLEITSAGTYTQTYVASDTLAGVSVYINEGAQTNNTCVIGMISLKEGVEDLPTKKRNNGLMMILKRRGRI